GKSAFQAKAAKLTDLRAPEKAVRGHLDGEAGKQKCMHAT
ncbi:hypothetical protein TGPRC2_224210B, partial [Toxoplasma gondii TgCatPRC2]